MKILIPITQTNSSSENPFVRVLQNGLSSYGHEVICSADAFWQQPTVFDLVYFQWPEGILNIHRNGPALNIIERQIQKIKHANIPICITCHNFHPHVNESYVSKVYDYLYSQADAVHHLGAYSCNYLKEKYPKALHFIAPHPIFYDVENIEISSEECKKRYGINKHKTTIISFGAFRNDSEHNLILDLKQQMPNRVTFWAPKFYSDSCKYNNKMFKIGLFAFNYMKYSMKGIKMNFKIISDEEVLPMVNAADILLIQRKEILNSGNLPLGFSAKKIVVGPNVGNVGEILRMTGNPVFEPDDDASILNAVEQAVNMFYESNQRGLLNYQYAKAHWTQERVAEIINESLIKIAHLV